MLRTMLAAAIAFSLLSDAYAARPVPNKPSTPEQRWQAWQQHEKLAQESLFGAMNWRSIGPTAQGGRVVDLAPVPGQPWGFYVAYATGGVWRTTNNGASFEPLTDRLPTTVTGAIAVDASKPKRLWVGTGEPNSSRSVYGGLGLFRSDDDGAHFERVGLADATAFARISVDPRDGSKVCTAVIGSAYTAGGARGVWCTSDDGKTWQNTLKPANAVTGAIDLVRDPKRPDVLYAATWERTRLPWKFTESGGGSGIWKSTDNGAHWTRLAGGLPGGDKIGRIGLSIAASRPDTVYASIDRWDPMPADQIELGDRPLSYKRLKAMSKEEFLRQDPEEIENFIRGNDLDTALDAKGLIEKVKDGSVSMAQLLDEVRARDNGFGDVDVRGLEVWRTDDAGGSWRKPHDAPIREVTYTYGYYFGMIKAAPDDPERVYIVGVPAVTSADGGKSWTTLQSDQVHGDYHVWWIDPSNAQRMIVGNDGGIDISYDGGKHWKGLDAQPVGQFYSITVDMAEPYNVYGGLQDNGSMKGSSQTRWEIDDRWSVIGGGDGMQVAVDTRDNQTLYTGYQFGNYARSGPAGRHEVRPRAELGAPPLRYNWDTPIALSSHLQDIVYFGANRLFRSMDKGETWTAISADLTSSKNRGNVPFATLTSFAESPKVFGRIVAGTDDGNLWLTDSGGSTWSAIGDGLPAERWVSRAILSAHQKDRIYVALNGYRQDDGSAYLYVSEDLGKHWTAIAANLPAEAINVVREDPVNADVLYVGTDRGVYVSIDRGHSWQGLGGNLPNVPVHDLAVHPRERELVAGTHGRSAWVIDVLPVQEASAKLQEEGAHLFPLAEIEADRDWRSAAPRWYLDDNALPKATISFWAKAAGKGTLTIVDGNGNSVREIAVDARRGINTVDWDVQVDQGLALAAEQAAVAKAKAAEAKKAESGEAGDAKAKDSSDKDKAADQGILAKTPYAESVRLGHRLFALPGDYKVKLALGDARSETKLEIKAPEARKPRAKAPPKLRGKDGYAGAATRMDAEARPESEDRD